MTIQKPDFNQIFASQAPDIDKPPVFNNYNGGMGDEYRPNNGKPTIKGFNYIQNLNDNKFLWMVQNGTFPYDPNTEYAVGVVTIKDGRFKQWNGTTWINFGQDDDALKSANNLSDLPNKTTARNNLDVYSKSETDAKLAPTPDATETVAGKAKIATTAIAQAGVNDTDIITALKLQQKFDASGFGINQLLSKPTTLANTWYMNTSGKVMFASNNAYGTNPSVGITVRQDGVEYSFSSGSPGNNLVAGVHVFAVIPIGAEYKCSNANMMVFS